MYSRVYTIDKDLDFVAIDEIQMCSDHERGHIYRSTFKYARKY